MPNRFELLLPDVAGAFHQGRAQVRQEDRERLADQELQAKVGRENQFRQLAGQAYGAQSPTQRQQFVSQAAAADPQGAMALDRQLGSNEERKQERLGVWAKALLNVPEGPTRAMLYQQMVPEMRAFGIEAPPQYTPEVGQMAQAFADIQSGQRPANLQYFDAMTAGMTPEDIEQARRVQMGLAARPSSAAIGYKIVKGADGRERLVAVDPRTPGAMTIDDGGGTFTSQTPGEKAAEETRAKESAEAEVKVQEERRQSQVAFQVYQQARDSLRNAMQGTDTGPIAGRLPAITSAQQIAEGATATMAPVLKQLFRTAGEGVFTDRDQQLLLDMLPRRTDHPEAAAAKIEMVDQLVAAKLGVPGSPAAAPSRAPVAAPSPGAAPAAPPGSGGEITATGPNGQKLVLRDGAWQPLR